MADTTSYENRYRKYLEDDYDTYLKEEPSTTSKMITGGLAAVGLAAGGFLAFKNGLMKDIAHSTISKMGSYRRGKMVAANESLRRWSEQEDLDSIFKGMGDIMKGNFEKGKQNIQSFVEAAKSFRTHMDGGAAEHADRMREIGKSQLIDKEFEAQRRISNMNHTIEKLRKEPNVKEDRIIAARKLMEEDIVNQSVTLAKEQEVRMKQTGFRFATIQDLIDTNEISPHEAFVQEGKRIFEEAGKIADDFLQTKADDFILIDEARNIADLRDFKNTFSGAVYSATTDFTIPLIKINPLRMFYLDQVFNPKNKPFYHVFGANQRNPIVTGHTGAAENPHLFINGNVYDTTQLNEDGTLKMIADRTYLVDAKNGPVARLFKNMSGITLSSFDKPKPTDPLSDRVKYKISEMTDIGMQDEPVSQFDIFDMTSWGASVINKVTGTLNQSKYRHDGQHFLKDAFGEDAEFIAFRRLKTLEESDGMIDYMKQFTAGRHDQDNITTGSLFFYGFFERLNATLNQVGLGLSTKNLGSGFDIFAGLLAYRVAPIWAGIELWDYLNYESENLLGFQFEDRFAQMYADTSVEIAEMRDRLGITDWAKDVAPLFVGGEQLAEFPVVGRLVDWNETAEETKEYWEEGEDPVRKGRWWPLGNTPFTGGKIDYWEPNWVRRTLADAEFSDSLYGSREEYFENSWMPTPRHPFAPIRHFVTDPYHYEEKHYYDRPYPVTGGIAEIENFPLIGPVLDSTIGRVLKPRRTMHEEVWQGEVSVTDHLESLPVSPEDFTPVMIGTEGGETVLVSGPPRPVEEDVSRALAMYVTSSGNVQLLSTDDQENIYKARSILSERSPANTADFRQERMPTTHVDVGELDMMSPAQWQQSLGNLHYNMTEMGGFYGFMSTTLSGELYDKPPVLQSSSDMTSYTRAFWDLDIGGYGGDANEIFRRFLPADRKLNEVNEIPNTMPDWMPGSDYFIDFQKGDPYVKVKKGEMRIPGEGYERLYGIDSEKLLRMDIGASSIGYGPEDIRARILQEDAIRDEYFQSVLDWGTDWHRAWEKEMAQKGIAISMEQYVRDDETNISGFYDLYGRHDRVLEWLTENAVEFKYYTSADGTGTSEEHEGFFNKPIDAMEMDDETRQQFFKFLLEQSDRVLVDPKTRGERAFNEREMYFENVQQVNFYADQMDTTINYLIHVNRDDPDAGIKVFAFEQNPYLLQYSIDKVEGVRNQIRQEMAQGTLHRGSLYDMIDRYRILADVAPYSQEFRDMKSQLGNMDLDEREEKEVREINRQVQMRKERQRFYQYRFKTANVENDMVTVDQVIDNNTFIAKEFPDNPIRLAGLYASTAQDNPQAEAVSEELSRTIQPGRRIRIAYDADEMNRVKNDTYNTIQSVVYDSRGRNINRYLIEEGLVRENENDFSPAAVHARFSQRQIAFGAAWEEFAHADTILHTKFLQVRSPLESYERREVYGKDWQEWEDPIGDFLVPAVQNAMTKHPLIAIAGGGLLGAAFGSLKSSDVGGEKVTARYGKIVGGVVGATVMGAAVMYRILHDTLSDEAWVPERRQKERDTEEYFDVLEYVKNTALFEKYAKEAMYREGFDIKSYIEQKQFDGELRKQRINDLEEIKRRIYTSKPGQWYQIIKELEENFGIQAEDRQDAMKKINAELNELRNHREIRPITPIAAKALQYHQATKQTMYGYEAGDPIANVLAALPKKDRDYLVPFIESPEEERGRILDIVPNYMRRVLQSAWGMEVDEKESLQEFFLRNPLPSAGWEGWRENVSLDDIKVKFVDRAGLDPSEFDIWPDDEARADAIDARVPNVFGGRENVSSFTTKISQILSGAGLDGVSIDVVESDVRGIQVDIDIEQNRRDDIRRVINNEGYMIL